MTHKGYFAQEFGGQTIYRCCLCAVDSFDEHRVSDHVRSTHGSLEVSPLVFSREPAKIMVSVLTWEDGEIGAQALRAVNEEMKVLYASPLEVKAVWIDNGSHELPTKFAQEDGWKFEHFKQNYGSSYARNVAVDSAQVFGADYLLMLDGDITIIPGSIQALVHRLRSFEGPTKPGASKVGCLGLHSDNCRLHYGDPRMLEVPAWSIRHAPRIAWTQYGLFDMGVFDFCRFDLNGPFAGPGWGFEDDDLYLQMLQSGWESINTSLFTYRHQHRRSSIRKLGSSLAAKLFEERKQYMQRKWGCYDNPAIRTHITRLANQNTG